MGTASVKSHNGKNEPGDNFQPKHRTSIDQNNADLIKNSLNISQNELFTSKRIYTGNEINPLSERAFPSHSMSRDIDHARESPSANNDYLSPVSRISCADDDSPTNQLHISGLQADKSMSSDEEEIDQIHIDDLESVAKYVDESRLRNRKRRVLNRKSPTVRISQNRGGVSFNNSNDFDDDLSTASLLSYDIGDDENCLGEEEDKYKLDSLPIIRIRADNEKSCLLPHSPISQQFPTPSLTNHYPRRSPTEQLSPQRSKRSLLATVSTSSTNASLASSRSSQGSVVEGTDKHNDGNLNDNGLIRNPANNAQNRSSLPYIYESSGLKQYLSSQDPVDARYFDKDSTLFELHQKKIQSYAHNAQLERDIEALKRHLAAADVVLANTPKVNESPRKKSTVSTQSRSGQGKLVDGKIDEDSVNDVSGVAKKHINPIATRVNIRGKNTVQSKRLGPRTPGNLHPSLSDEGDSDGTAVSGNHHFMKYELHHRDTLDIGMESIGDDESFEDIIGSSGENFPNIAKESSTDKMEVPYNYEIKAISTFDSGNSSSSVVQPVSRLTVSEQKPSYPRHAAGNSDIIKGSSQRNIQGSSLLPQVKNDSVYSHHVRRQAYQNVDSSDTENDNDHLSINRQGRGLNKANANVLKPHKPLEPSSVSSAGIRQYRSGNINQMAIAAGTQITAASHVSARLHQHVAGPVHTMHSSHNDSSTNAHRPNLRVRTNGLHPDHIDPNTAHFSHPSSTSSVTARQRRVSRSLSGIAIPSVPCLSTSINSPTSSSTIDRGFGGPSAGVVVSHTPSAHAVPLLPSPRSSVTRFHSNGSPRASRSDQSRDVLRRLNRRQRKPIEGGESGVNSASEDDISDRGSNSISCNESINTIACGNPILPNHGSITSVLNASNDTIAASLMNTPNDHLKSLPKNSSNQGYQNSLEIISENDSNDFQSHLSLGLQPNRRRIRGLHGTMASSTVSSASTTSVNTILPVMGTGPTVVGDSSNHSPLISDRGDGSISSSLHAPHSSNIMTRKVLQSVDCSPRRKAMGIVTSVAAVTAGDAHQDKNSNHSKPWSDDLESSWHEVKLLLRRRIETDADMQYTIGAAEAGLLYSDKLNEVAKSLNVLRGTLSRWVLPFDSNTRIDCQCSTPTSVLERIPEHLRGKISDRQIQYLVTGANSVRQLVRIKIADDNDMEQARKALLKSKNFFSKLHDEAIVAHILPFQLLQRIQE